ncbi:MAG: hypothetical protein OFPI_13510 [Osedax symbiont Rs2]|nr:MAG: hypothetical protein OFPI_13510 [Osedax symbiont Rs2]
MTIANAIKFFCQLGVHQDSVVEHSKLFKAVSYSATEPLLPRGERQKFAFLISSGIVQACHYSTTGVIRTKEYYFPQELCLLYSHWLCNTAAGYQLEALQSVQAIRIPLQLLSLEPWQPALLQLLKQQLLYKEAKEQLLLLKTPQQRYLHLIKHSPLWIEQLNNMQIAHYIGISPISLSRIKARIKQN